MRRSSRLGARFKKELPGLGLLAAALLFNAIFLWPEARFDRVPPNDLVFHLTASERMKDALGSGEPLLDPWVSEWSLGYPLWRSYQPLPHLGAALFLRASAPFASPEAAFAGLYYALLVLLPMSVYVGGRWLGLSPSSAGLACVLVLLPSSTGEPGRYGLGYGATTWRGSGLYTQLFALHLLVLGLGAVVRALERGGRRWLAALLLALTALSHIVFGYVAFLSSAVLALVGPSAERSRRLVRWTTIAVPALTLLLWFVVPLAIARGDVNHSRWEDVLKWDSFGAPFLLRELASGRFFDVGRQPVLTILLALGITGALIGVRRDALARRLLALTATWLLLFFGRATWGHLLLLVGVPRDFHLHRLQAAFELCVILAAAHGLATWRRWRLAATIVIATAVVGAVGVAAVERAHYLNEQIPWGNETMDAYARERGDLAAAIVDIRHILAERPGRVTAGKAATWGRDFKIGSVQLYAFLARAHLDSPSFLYHSMSLTSDIMVLRDEVDYSHDVAFGVRAVLAPVTQPVSPHWKPRGQHGRFAVYETSPEGYFGLVDIGAVYDGPRVGWYDTNSAWLGSPLLRYGVVAALSRSDGVPAAPTFARWAPFPEPAPELLTPRGRILEETKVGEIYRARLALDRPCFAFVKITYDAGLVARVDGRRTPLVRVTPGFAAVPVGAGEHEVEVRYEPGSLRAVLLVLGLAAFVGGVVAMRRGRLGALEGAAEQRLESWGGRFANARTLTAIALLLCSLIALRPLFRGLLISGHDATEYLPRLEEMRAVLADGQIPPVWAPDLGNGHGQPLFEFAPPLLYLVALVPRISGAGIADSLQLALALLHLAGAVAIYRIGRLRGFDRYASSGAAIAWLFAPYLMLDLFVRTAYAEAAAVASAPIALYGLLRAIERPSIARVAIGGLSVALVVLAHNAVTLLLLPALALCVVAAAVDAPPKRRLSAFGAGAATLVTGLLLSAFFWLPAMGERDLVKTNLLREDFLQWKLHAVSARQLLWSKWGFGLSGAGEGDGMSFAIGPLHLALAAVGLYLVLRRYRQTEGPTDRGRAIVLPLAFAAAAAAGAWLSTTASSPLWSRLELLQYLAYPWRALLLPALFLPLVALPAFAALGRRRWAFLLVIAVLLAINLRHTEPKGYLTFDDEFYATDAIGPRGLNTTTREEYEPRWVVERPPFQADRLRGVGAPIEVSQVNRRSDREEYDVVTASATAVETATFFYPGWAILVDGTKVSSTPVPHRGTMAFELPPGRHRVVLELHPTTLRRLATRISGWATVLLIGAVLLEAAARQRRQL